MTGDHGIYDVDSAVLVMTGKGLKIVTQRDTITARDSIEWYDQKQLGVARGNAVALRADRRVRGDVLTAQVEKQANGQSRVSRIDANGNVLVSSPGQIARGDAGVYNLDTGIATLTGHVRLTRGENELRGRYAVVDLNTNVSRLLSAPPGPQVAGRDGRVEGLIVPRPKQRGTIKLTMPTPRLVADNTGLVGSNLGKSFRRRPVLRSVNISVAARRGGGPARPQRRRQDHLLLHHHRPDHGPTSAPSRSTARTSPNCRCIAARGSASAICRRRRRSSAA